MTDGAVELEENLPLGELQGGLDVCHYLYGKPSGEQVVHRVHPPRFLSRASVTVP